MKQTKRVKKFLIWMGFFGLFGGIGVMAIDHLIYESDLFLLKELQIAEIEGQEKNLNSEVRLTIATRLSELLQRPVWALNLLEIQSDLEKLEWVSEASVQRWFPNGLKIFVKQKRVVANYLRDHRKIFPVAQDGSLILGAKILRVSDHPYLRGEVFEDLEIRKRAIELIELFPQKGPLTSREISEIFFVQKRGFELQLVGRLGRVLLGEGDFQLKAIRVGKVVEELQRQGIENRVIDARYASKVIVKQ